MSTDRKCHAFIPANVSAASVSPAWLFPVACTILYILIGAASYFIWSADQNYAVSHSEIRMWLIVYAISLVFNFFWMRSSSV